VVSFTARPLYPQGKEPPSRTDWRGGCGEEKNLALPGIEPGQASPFLYRLSYLDSLSLNSLIVNL
jgi:hypothetical protein